MNVVDTAPVILFFKAHVGPYLRRGKLVNLAGYQGKQARAVASAGQMDMFGENPTDSAHASGGNWQMPIKDAIREHKELIHAAETPGKADDKREVEKQKEELGRMEAASSESSQRDAIFRAVNPARNKLREMANAADSDKDEKAFRKLMLSVVDAANGDFNAMQAVEKSSRMKKFASLKSDFESVLGHGAVNLIHQWRESRGQISAANGGRAFDVKPEVKEMFNKWTGKIWSDELGKIDGAAAYNAAVTSTKPGPDDEHKPGVLNERLGVGASEPRFEYPSLVDEQQRKKIQDWHAKGANPATRPAERAIYLPSMSEGNLKKILAKTKLTADDIEALKDYKYLILAQPRDAAEKGFMEHLVTDHGGVLVPKDKFLLVNINHKISEMAATEAKPLTKSIVFIKRQQLPPS